MSLESRLSVLLGNDTGKLTLLGSKLEPSMVIPDTKKEIKRIVEENDEALLTLLEQANTQEEKQAQIQVKYAEMVKDIYDEMENVFSTRNDVSAQATASTYEAMLKRPINYVGTLGLVDENAVTLYATTKILSADNYAIFRLNRIAQFQAEKDAIINS